MKPLVPRLLLIFVLVLGSSALGQSVGRQDGGMKCSLRTLSGDYGALIVGTEYLPNPPDQPIKVDLRTVSMGHYDGMGNYTGRDHVVFAGNPPEDEWRDSGGTYLVNSDCTGRLSIIPAPGFPPIIVHFVIVNNGKEVQGVTNGSAITYSAHRVKVDQ